VYYSADWRSPVKERGIKIASNRDQFMVWRITAVIAATLLGSAVQGRGVSPYLPLNQSPEIERQIEKILILADKPVMTRPIAAATVWDALPAACELNPVICAQVRNYLSAYMHSAGLTHASLAISATSGKRTTLPNRHGMDSKSGFEASAAGFWQPSDYLLLSAGMLTYKDETLATGTMISVGTEYAQVDIGFRDHWFSPLSDNSGLISTHAETMPSITVSNYTPLTRWGIHYEAFVAEMSRSARIEHRGETTSGEPSLAGLHLSIEPVPGWSLGINRLLQFGGGGHSTSFGDFTDALLNPSEFDNTGSDRDFGNQLSSITSRFMSQGSVPFTVYFEYAAEDTSFTDNFRLGNVGLSGGIFFPSLWQGLDLTVEFSEWQNGWYTHHIYGDGLRHDGNVLGHWGGDWRELGDAVGGQSFMAQLGWPSVFGGQLETTIRTLNNDSYTAPNYQRAHAVELLYSRLWGEFYVGGEVHVGSDVFGKSYSRVSAFIRF